MRKMNDKTLKKYNYWCYKSNIYGFLYDYIRSFYENDIELRNYIRSRKIKLPKSKSKRKYKKYFRMYDRYNLKYNLLERQIESSYHTCMKCGGAKHYRYSSLCYNCDTVLQEIEQILKDELNKNS